METHEITVQQVWSYGKARFIKTPEEKTYFSSDAAIASTFHAGACFTAQVEPPEEGKKAWRIVGVGPQQVLAESTVKPIVSPNVETAQKSDTSAPKVEHIVSGQEMGLVHKCIHELVINKKLGEVFGEKIGINVLKYYRGWILSTTKIPYDGKDLPNFVPKKE